jgi:hypothetical protein
VNRSDRLASCTTELLAEVEREVARITKKPFDTAFFSLPSVERLLTILSKHFKAAARDRSNAPRRRRTRVARR